MWKDLNTCILIKIKLRLKFCNARIKIILTKTRINLQLKMIIYNDIISDYRNEANKVFFQILINDLVVMRNMIYLKLEYYYYY